MGRNTHITRLVADCSGQYSDFEDVTLYSNPALDLASERGKGKPHP